MRIHDERECSDAAALFGGFRSAEASAGASGPCLSEELVLAFSEGRSAPHELERLHDLHSKKAQRRPERMADACAATGAGNHKAPLGANSRDMK